MNHGCCGCLMNSQRKSDPLRANIPLSQIDFGHKPAEFVGETFGKSAIQDEQQQLAYFLKDLKKNASVMVVIYGSQTGTAAGFAGRLVLKGKGMGIHSIMVDPGKIQRYEDLIRLADIGNHILVFIVATYGDGGPTNNAQRLWQWVSSTRTSLKGVHYAVFGLGDSGYKYFNGFGKLIDERMSFLGGIRLQDLGLGDAAADIDDDFEEWKEMLTENVFAKYGNKSGQNMSQYKLVYISKPNSKNIFKGEASTNASYSEQTPPFNSDNPFLARTLDCQELCQNKAERSCLKITLDITGSRLYWQVGDHVGVYVQNHFDDVNKLAEILSFNPNQIIDYCNKEESQERLKRRFPSPCSLQTAFLFYLDINRPTSRRLLKQLATFASDSSEKQFLTRLGSHEGKEDYHQFVIAGFKTLVHLLETFPSCRPPLNLLLEYLPRLKPRFYSISSSPKKNRNEVVITVAQVRTDIPDINFNEADRANKHRIIFKGVASTYLSSIAAAAPPPPAAAASSEVPKPGRLVPVFLRKGKVILPEDQTIPIILIGAGTGVSPFIGFIQDREMAKKGEGEEEKHGGGGKVGGDIFLYFGCRNQDEDFLYRYYLEEMLEKNVLTQLNVAFSRQNESKIYVQHLLLRDKLSIWKTMASGGLVYVGGDARGMAKSVEGVLQDIVEECGDGIDGGKFIEEMKVRGRYQQDVWTSPFAQFTRNANRNSRIAQQDVYSVASEIPARSSGNDRVCEKI